MKTKTFFFIIAIVWISVVTTYAQSWTTGTSLLYTNPTTTKVGIGITNPTEMLHVNGGGLKIGNSTASADRSLNILKFGDGNYVNIGEWEADDMLSFKASRYNFANGNVGIGTASPAYKLDVNGTMRTTKLLITQPNAVTDWNTLWQSGFYDGNNAANAPGGSDWYWGIHMGHRSNNSNYRFGGQIAISFNSPKMYFRSIDVSGKGTWTEVLTKDDKNLEFIEKVTLNPNDNFTYDGRTVDHYSFSWGSDSWCVEGPTLWVSSYAGIKFFTKGTPRMSIHYNGNVGIGTDNPGTKLDVVGVIRAHEVKVCLNQGCDFVFEPDYKLMPLNELDKFVTKNRHLPEVAPAAQMEDEGINLSEMNAKLLQKVEELTLYIIQQQKTITQLSNDVEYLKTQNK